MINQTSQFFAILTNVGVAKQANADALGVPWKLTQMGVGDANDTDPVPNATQTKLINERRRAPLNQLKVDPANSAIIIAEQVIPAEVGGWWVREIGLYDADGDLVAIANCAPSFKPQLTQGSGRTQVVRINLQVSNSSNVELKIDPSVVLATRTYVDQKVLEELSKQDFKFSVVAATTGTVALNGIQAIDGEPGVAGMRVLVWKQAVPRDNGIYIMSNSGWARALDADSSLEVTPGLFVHVEKGATYSDSIFQLVTDAPIILGATDLTFESPVGRTGISAGTYRSVTVDKFGRVIGATNPTTLSEYGITDTYTKAQVDAMIAQASALPIGAQVSFPVNKIAPGFLERDGSVQSIAAYPDLATYLAGAFNKGDEGSGNFRLPDSRGEFERGWDHGRGVDAGRAVGSNQKATLVGIDAVDASANAKQSTTAAYQMDATNNYAAGIVAVGGDPIKRADYLKAGCTIYPSDASGTQYLDTDQIFSNGGVVGARPRNVAVVMCIKAWNAPINQGNIDIAALAALAAQASETKQGTAKVSTQALVDAGADDTTIVTPKKLRWGFSILKASNGYIVFPSWLGGLIIQWGSLPIAGNNAANLTLLPIAWPNGFLQGVAAFAGAANSGANVGIDGASGSKTQINLYQASTGGLNVRFVAVGY